MSSRFSLRTASALLAAAMALAAPFAPAHAATFLAKLEYRDGLTGAQAAYGQVKLEELDSKTVKVTVTLTDPNSLVVNTGGDHNPFVFSTITSDTVTILSPIDTFVNGGRGVFNSTPFGNFTNDIACCNGRNGAARGETPPLVFSVKNAAGFSVAGVGYTVNALNQVITFGSGDRFLGSTGSTVLDLAHAPVPFLFAADIFDKRTGLTYNVAARYFERVSTSVPEPGAWAMMLLGFGGLGAMLRRRRAATRVAVG